mgnify:CR=1 FL=1
MSGTPRHLLDDSLVYQSLLQAIPDIIYIIDETGNFTFVNEAVRRLGHEPDELVGKHFSALLPDKSLEEVSYQHAMVRLKGTVTGNDAAPGLFDERRTGTRITRNLRLQLTPRDWDGKTGHLDGEAYAMGIHRPSPGEQENRYAGTIGIIKDVSEVAKTEKTLMKTIHYYEMLIEHISDIILIVAGDGTILYASPSVTRLLSYTDAELIGESELDFLHPDERGSMEQFLATQAMWQMGEWKIECRLLHRDGEWLYFEKTVRPIFDDNKVTTCFVCYLEDITRQKLAEEELARSERRFRRLIEGSRDVIYRYRLRPFPGFDYVSPAVEEITGYSPAQLYENPGLFTELIHREDLPQIQDPTPASSMFEKPFLLRFAHREGGLVITEHTVVTVLDEKGDLCAIEGVARDVTERQNAEERIITSLHEKEILLKEIHHRVKNNMQIISSLLNIQAQAVTDPAMTAMFSDMRNRIHSMALIHNSLYQAADLASIDFGSYIPRLVQMIAGGTSLPGRRIRMEVNVRNVLLNVNLAVPCGLIINELVSNAIKYAFPEGRKGSIYIEGSLDDEGMYRFRVRDDGVGLPAGFDMDKSTTLGMYIVRILTDQLGGSLQVCSSGGAEFTISFHGAGRRT